MQLYNQNKCVILFMEKGNSTMVAPDQETYTAATMLWDKVLLVYFFLNLWLHLHSCQDYQHKFKMWHIDYNQMNCIRTKPRISSML